MAMIVGYDQENGRRVYLNLEQVMKIAHHQAGGSLVTFINNEVVRVMAEPEVIANHASAKN